MEKGNTRKLIIPRNPVYIGIAERKTERFNTQLHKEMSEYVR